MRKKIRRYINLIKNFSNWGSFLWYKIRNTHSDFIFKLRNSFRVRVPKKMLAPFKECFFDELYLRHISNKVFEKEKPVIMDIGANVGYFSLYIYSKFPGSRIYAFEPHPYCFHIIEEYKKEFDTIDLTLYQMAVSGKNGQLVLYADKPGNFLTTASIYPGDNIQSEFRIDSISIDSFMKGNNIDWIDFVKMDCEGAEYEIIYNISDEFLPRIRALSVETHRRDQPHQNIQELKAYLESKGYQVYSEHFKWTGHLWAER